MRGLAPGPKVKIGFGGGGAVFPVATTYPQCD
jgi:hypothetical protein